MLDQKHITAELFGGPRDGDTGDHHTGVSELRFDSASNPATHHAYALEAILGGVARYVYVGVIVA